LSHDHVGVRRVAILADLPDGAGVVHDAVLVTHDEIPHVLAVLSVVGAHNHNVALKDAVVPSVILSMGLRDGKLG
jgi:hypothetical protein